MMRPPVPLTPRIQEALAELQALILDRFPDATFEVHQGDEPWGIYLHATVDVDSLWDVIDVVSDRLVDFQVNEELPVFIDVHRTPERDAATWAEQAERQAALSTP